MKENKQSILLQGLIDLISSNTENITGMMASNTENMKFFFQNLRKREHSPSIHPLSQKSTKLTKPAKVPSWTNDMSLETYVKQLTTWQQINEDIPEFAKYHELIEELKRNKDIKGLQKFLADHILPVIETKEDQNVKKVVTLLNERYGGTHTEKVEEAIED